MSFYSKERFLVLSDFETTGLSFDEDFPIEIGLIITDPQLVIQETYQTIIRYPDLDKLLENETEWPAHMIPAYNVHKISVEEYKSGKSIAVVVEELRRLIAKYSQTVNGRKLTPVLTSDNIQFEYRWMDFILKYSGLSTASIFHYCGWDTSMTLDLITTVGDPKPVHRAFADTALLYRNLVRAFSVTNGDKLKSVF